MRGPWARIKIIWYRRQMKRVIWFHGYLDRVLREVGMNGAEVKQAWRDFTHSAYHRAAILDRVAVANKIKIRRAARSKLEKGVFAMVQQVNALIDENAKLKAEIVKDRTECRDAAANAKPPADTVVSDGAKENTHEISIH